MKRIAAIVALAVATALTPAAIGEPPKPAAPPPVAPVLPKPAAAPAPFAGLKPTEVSVLRSRRIDFTSAVNGQRYSLAIAVPFAPPPREGYAVIYVLDGSGYFGSATEAARGNGLPIVVVGIGYPFDDPDFISKTTGRPRQANSEVSLVDFGAAVQMTRNLDLTPPTAPEFVDKQRGMKGMKVGGADAFLKVIETEIKPKVAAILPIDPNRTALYGHSLGGLAVLRALFTEPTAFRTYIAASPSIWWNDRSVLADESAFSTAVTTGAASPRVLITAGALEQTALPPPPGSELTQADVDTMVQSARMVDNAKDLAARLKALKGTSGYEVESAVFADESHGSVEQAAVARGVHFAAKASPPKP